MQLELFDDPFDACEPDPEPALSGVPYVRQKGGQKPGPGAVPCNAAGGCTYGNIASRQVSGALKRGGLCERHGREKAHGYRPCGRVRGCGNQATHGIVDFNESGESDPSVLLCDSCYDYERNDEKRAMLVDVLCQGDSGECLNDVFPRCPEGVHLCQMHNRHRRRDYVPCVGPECVLLSEHLVQTGVPGGQELCGGHYLQVQRGDPLTPLGSTGGGYSPTDKRGGWLYIVLGEGDGVPMFHGFGITNRVEKRTGTHRREVPGIEFLYRFWWADAGVAADIERGWKARLAVYNSGRPGSFTTEAFPACIGTVYAMLADVAERSPEKTIEGD